MPSLPLAKKQQGENWGNHEGDRLNKKGGRGRRGGTHSTQKKLSERRRKGTLRGNCKAKERRCTIINKKVKKDRVEYGKINRKNRQETRKSNYRLESTRNGIALEQGRKARTNTPGEWLRTTHSPRRHRAKLGVAIEEERRRQRPPRFSWKILRKKNK